MPSGDDATVHTRATLPPPDFGAAQPAFATSHGSQRDADPLARRKERRAEEASLRYERSRASEKGEAQAEATACVALARMLASQERSLEEAIEAASRALAIADDSELRSELAGWLEAIGRHDVAAETLERGTSLTAAILSRAGVLHARAGDAAKARAVLARAAELDATDALSLELLAALSGWAPEEVDAATAAHHYLEAARRRRQANALAAELEDCVRAFEADPTSEDATSALRAALVLRGKIAAAAEVTRAHTRALDPSKARSILMTVIDESGSDVLGALGAAFDARLDVEFAGRGSTTFDELLLRAGILELLAARLELRAERAQGTERIAIYEQLARLASGPLASPNRAALEHVRILAEDPAKEQVIAALEAYAASTRDQVPLVEGLVRGASASRGSLAGRALCAKALASLAEDRLHHGKLARWAFEQWLGAEPGDAAAASAAQRLAGAEGTADYGAWLRTLEQQLGRDTRSFGLGRWLLGLELERPDELEARASVAAAARARGNATEANETTLPLLLRDNASARAISLAWVNAALAQDELGRARAIERLAAFSAPETQALLAAVAADAFASAGDRASARQAATAACRAEPNSVRGTGALARACLGALDRTAASAIERGVQLTYASGAACIALADALASLGERHYAVAWSQRLVALRPGDVRAVERLVTRAIESADASRIADVLAWVIPQSYPAAAVAPIVARGLLALRELDAERSALVARRALDAFGARDGELRDVVLDVARRAEDGSLVAAALERRLASDLTLEQRARALFELAEARRLLGDRDGEARALRSALRARRASADQPHDPALDLEPAVASLLGESLSPDGEIAWLELRAEVLTAKLSGGPIRATRAQAPRDSMSPDGALRRAAHMAWRELGAIHWDMVGDRRAALEAWTRGAKLVLGGFARLALDVTQFADPRSAVVILTDLAAAVTDTASAGAIAAQAARAALAAGDPARALELARDALSRDAALTEALELAERGAVGSGRPKEMSKIYEVVSSGARGRFGRRAAHYRGARFFEQRGDLPLALRHAAQAFAAVPSEGATFLLLARTAERAGDPGAAVLTIEEVASGARSAGVRAAWLLRAADVAGSGEDGARRRVDLLLRAALLTPTVSVINRLGDSGRALLRYAPEERDALQIRFGRASKTLTQRLDGPDGARVGIDFARLALDLFEDADGALDAIERALDADADLEEYILLVPSAATLSKSVAADAAVARAVALVDKPYSNVGVPALRLFSAIAKQRGDAVSVGRFVLLAAERESDDDQLVREADDVLRSAEPSPSVERFNRRVPETRRAEAWRAFAESERAAGRYEKVIEALERVKTCCPPEKRDAIESEIREAYTLAGRAEDLEVRARREAERDGSPHAARADAWSEVAHLREERGDVIGANAALLEAASLDPAPLERWSSLERIASLAGAFDVRVRALGEIETRVKEDARPAVLRRLAHAQEESGDLVGMQQTWKRVLEHRPDDEEADRAIEALLAQASDFVRLADHLARRADRLARTGDQRDTLRVVRLRRAAILEQRLGQVAQACEELERLVAEWPNNESAVRYLADLYERSGRPARAVSLWQRLATLATTDTARGDLMVRAATAARASGDTETAAALAEQASTAPFARQAALTLVVQIARDRQDDTTLARALAALADSWLDEPIRAAEMLIEAAQACARSGDVSGALAHAQRAATVAPTRAGAQLFARGLEYRLRGAGTPAEAGYTIAELGRVEGPLDVDDAALHAFLRAEALDAVHGGDAGLVELEVASTRWGSHGLIEVGIAERYARAYRWVEALPHFERAVQGQLLGLRGTAAIALAASEVAERAQRADIALAFLEVAAQDLTLRERAQKRIAHVAAQMGDLARTRVVLDELIKTSSPDDRPVLMAQLARALSSSARLEERAEAATTFQRAIEASPEGSVLRAQLTAEIGTLSSRPPSAPPPRDAEPVLLVTQSSTTSEVASKEPTDPHAKLALGRAALERGDQSVAELLFVECLTAGLVEAGDELAALLERSPARSSDLVRVRRLQVDFRPGDRRLLKALRSAALGDHNPTFARAVDHVLRTFDSSSGPMPPPPLSAQVEQQGMLQLLARATGDPWGDVVTLVWETASVVLGRDLQTYGVAGTDRVSAGPSTTIARLYEQATRLLGTNPPLYTRRPTDRASRVSFSPGPLHGAVLLTQPLAAIVGGDDMRDDSPALRYALGVAMASALPRNAMVMGLSLAQTKSVWSALLAAFGPAGSGRALEAQASRLVEALWTTMPARAQRRVQEILMSADPELAPILERTQQTTRRVGLFLAGDFESCVRTIAADAGIGEEELATGSLETLCARPIVADLLRLAVRPEYADARFRPLPEGPARPSGKFAV